MAPPDPSTAASTVRSAAGLGAATAVSRVLGFVRVLVVAAVLGTTFLGNAFQSANAVSNVLFELLAAGALSAVLVPTFVDLLDAGRRDEAETVAGGVLWVALAGLGVLTVICVAGAPLLARPLTAGVPAAIADEQRELVTYLLRFFVPQVLLYAAGTVAIAVLQASRRFTMIGVAPIGNTVVSVAALVAFRLAAGPDPGLELTSGERLLLVVAGTGGVAAFVGTLLAGCAGTGFRLRPRRPRRDPRVVAALRHSGWGVVLHTGAGILLGTAVIAGAAVEGGVVAYQVAWVFFLAPYGVLGQPIATTLLPELVREAREDRAAFSGSLRWALERMALLVLPVSAAALALALPAMRTVAFGETAGEGAELLAAALASLAAGLFPYCAFLFLARACYALGDSRTPGIVSLAAAVVGAVVMAAGAMLTDGAARVAMLGVGHTVAQVVAALALGLHLTVRERVGTWPAAIWRVTLVVAVAGTACWLVARLALDGESSRLTNAAVVALLVAAGAAIVAGGYRVTGVHGALSRRVAT